MATAVKLDTNNSVNVKGFPNYDASFGDYAQGAVAAMLARISPTVAEYLNSLTAEQQAMLSESMTAAKSQATADAAASAGAAAISIAGAAGSAFGAYSSIKALGELNDLKKAFNAAEEQDALEATKKNSPNVQFKNGQNNVTNPANRNAPGTEIEMEEVGAKDPDESRKPLNEDAKAKATERRRKYDADREEVRIRENSYSNVGNALGKVGELVGHGINAAANSTRDIEAAHAQLTQSQTEQANSSKQTILSGWDSTLSAARELMSYGSSMVRG